jgi:hypothetical protein
MMCLLYQTSFVALDIASTCTWTPREHPLTTATCSSQSGAECDLDTVYADSSS